MTTVTEAAKRLGVDPVSLERADLETIKSDPVLAQQLARQLAALARDLVPGSSPSIEDLHELLEMAVRGVREENASPIIEGRNLRKRVREHCAACERSGESFALVVLHLVPEPSPGLYLRSMETAVVRLRRSDMVTVYRRRIAMLLPKMKEGALPPIVARICAQIDRDAGTRVVEGVSELLYPSEGHAETQSALDWLEDELRVE